MVVLFVRRLVTLFQRGTINYKTTINVIFSRRSYISLNHFQLKDVKLIQKV